MAEAVSRDGQVKVEWVDLGEGMCGDWDPDDPADVALLRYDAYVLVSPDSRLNELRGVEHTAGDTWGVKADGSYCTRAPVGTDEEILTSLAQVIADQLADNGGFKRTAEELSWVEPGWLTRT